MDWDRRQMRREMQDRTRGQYVRASAWLVLQQMFVFSLRGCLVGGLQLLACVGMAVVAWNVADGGWLPSLFFAVGCGLLAQMAVLPLCTVLSSPWPLGRSWMVTSGLLLIAVGLGIGQWVTGRDLVAPEVEILPPTFLLLLVLVLFLTSWILPRLGREALLSSVVEQWSDNDDGEAGRGESPST